MAEPFDGWAVLGRIAQRRDAFPAAAPLAADVAALLVRTQLCNGGARADQLVRLIDAIGIGAVTAVIARLADYEALQILDASGAGPAGLTGEQARQRLEALATAAATPAGRTVGGNYLSQRLRADG